jgi:hypothetical protein
VLTLQQAQNYQVDSTHALLLNDYKKAMKDSSRRKKLSHSISEEN